MRRHILLAAALALSITPLAACGGSQQSAGSQAAQAHGPIKIWYSNNKDEVAWGKQVVAAWNASHPTEQVSAEELPTGQSSEEVIGAAITAGTEPCLIYNTSPASVPVFQKQGGLVSLNDFPDGASYIEQRSGGRAGEYKSPDGKYYSLPWKSNPDMIFYNKAAMAKAGLDPNNPPLSTFADFLSTSRKLVSSGAAKYAIDPTPTSQFYQSWFDFYPLFLAESGGKQLVADGKAQFNSPAGQAVIDLWHTIYAENLAGKEKENGDVFSSGKAAMALSGPYSISTYQGKIDWGVAPVPTSAGADPKTVHTFGDAKNIGMYASCKNRGTAWDFLKFSTSADQDGKFLSTTGQMPIRDNLAQQYPQYFASHPAYTTFADQADRAGGVPNVPNSIAIWQTFRDAWSKSVIFGQADPAQTMSAAAAKVDQLAAGSR